MSRPQAFGVSILLALAAAAGAWAVTSTGAVRSEATKPELAGEQAIARRSKQLDAWQTALERAARARPPALPAVPHYPKLPRIAIPAAAPLPVFAPPHTKPAATQTAAPGRTRAPRTGAAALVSAHPAPAAPAPPPAPTTTATSPQTPEQQCEALKQAAENQGEAARRAAEEQCRKLLGDGSEGGDG